MRLPTHLLFSLLLGLLHLACALSEHAMTTVLARPLGGYGLTPLIFELSNSNNLLGLSSNSIETKVRKSPVFELIMPNYDDEPIATGFEAPAMANKQPVKQPARKIDYESIISKNDKTVSAAPSTNSYYSTGGMLGSNVLFGGKGQNSYYNEPLPSYKEQVSRSDFGKSSQSYHSQSQSYGGGGGGGGPLNAAIQSVRSVEVKDVQNIYENNEPQVIDIAPSGLPIIINFRTSSSQIQIHQTHEKSEPVVVPDSKSEDEPTYLKHEVTKPVIQEVHEIILPYRRITQEIKPVHEEIKTIVARGKPREGKSKGQGKYHASAGYGGGATSSKSASDGKYKS